MNRRGFMRSILAAGIAPYVVTAAGVLMPVRRIVSAPAGVLTEEFLRSYMNNVWRELSRAPAPDFIYKGVPIYCDPTMPVDYWRAEARR